MVATQFFGKRLKIGVFDDFERPDCLEKMVLLLPARFQGPQKMGVTFFWPFFVFSSFFLFLLHLARGCSKNHIFIGFLHTLLKHLVTSCSNKEVKPKLPKKGAYFFSETSFFDQKQLSKTLILHHPLKIVHQKSPKPLFL